MHRGIQLLAASALALPFVPTPAAACSCMEVTVEQAWHEYGDMFLGTVREERRRGLLRQYLVEVRQPYAGCTVPGDLVVVSTPASSASCGVTLRLGRTYVLSATSGPRDPERFLINACGYNLPASRVPAEDLAYLESRPLSCDGGLACADGDRPALCVVDPCSVDPGCAAAVTCESNPCSDTPCDAEFYDEGWQPVCEVEPAFPVSVGQATPVNTTAR